MTIGALKLRYIAQVDRMFECLIGSVTRCTLPISERAQIHRMTVFAQFNVAFRRGLGIIDGRVTDIAVAGDDLARLAYVVPAMTSEAPH